MAIEVLQSQAENNSARAEMHRRRIDCTGSLFSRIARKMGIITGVNVGEHYKSWDVLKTIKLIQDNLPLDAPILDIGACASELPCALHRLGYTQLTGVDLNPGLRHMPYADKINYVVSDFMHTPFKEAAFSAVTAISVIEHGLKAQQLLSELSRILKPGGFFIASVDYWPEKVDTNGIQVFGMDWMIFSKDDLLAFIKDAEKFNLIPHGEMRFDATDHVIKWQEKQYTFAWLVFKKRSKLSSLPIKL